jgi:DNA-binding MarR family transcriptional regulator
MANLNILFEQFHRMFNIAVQKEMLPRTLPNGELLYRIEIHVVDAIGSHPGSNLTELAKILGVTKGAISQKVKILEKKDYIRRYKSLYNNKEVLFELTERGMKIYLSHREFHKQLNQKMIDAAGSIDDADISKLIKILTILEKHFETL